MAHEIATADIPPLTVLKAGAAERAAFAATVNRAVAREETIGKQIAIFKDGQNLTDRLKLSGGKGWFTPMVRDLLKQGVSVVVNDVEITGPSMRAIETVTGIPADWVFQHNLYITPREVQGFVPHCDPHVVAVAQLYGRKDWYIYDRQFDNPVSLDGRKDVLVADPKENLRVRETIAVEPGDVFVIPRGRFHAARAKDGGSVHIAVGCAGIRPVDVVWEMAAAAMRRSDMRADMTPEEARAATEAFIRAHKPAAPPLPRFPAPEMAVPDDAPALSFQEALHVL